MIYIFWKGKVVPKKLYSVGSETVVHDAFGFFIMGKKCCRVYMAGRAFMRISGINLSRPSGALAEKLLLVRHY